MKHVGLFKTFLDDVVNLNDTRLSLLTDSVEAIKNFIRGSDWEPKIKGFLEQGSWAHKTIIKPVQGAPFDADILVRVAPVDGWEAKDYINELRRVFKASGTYADKVSSFSHCVTITYQGERKIDVAPLVIDRVGSSEEVCNRTANDFESSAPKRYTEWFNELNGYSGSNSFRKVTRLIKYLRDTKRTFTCPSVLLTTLLGQRISWLDKDTAGFEDTPTALKTVMGRLDDYLQGYSSKPSVPNPSMESEDFADLWSDSEYSNFRSFVNKYRGWIDTAYDETDLEASIEAWQKIFGDQFGKSALTKAEASFNIVAVRSTMATLLSSVADHSDRLVEFVVEFGTSLLPASFNRPPHQQAPTWPRAAMPAIPVYVSATYHSNKESDGRRIASGEALPCRGGIWFEARLRAGAPVPAEHSIQWRITNTGHAALSRQAGRGIFYTPDVGTRRWETLSYRGVHIAEAFLLNRLEGTILGQSAPFHVVIT